MSVGVFAGRDESCYRTCFELGLISRFYAARMKTNSGVLKLVAAKLEANNAGKSDASLKSVTLRLEAGVSKSLDELAERLGTTRVALAHEFLVTSINEASAFVARSDAGKHKAKNAAD